MAIDVSALTDYAWSDIKKAAKTAMIASALGGTNYTINGRSFGRITPDEARKLYEFADAQDQVETNGMAGANVLVQFGEII